MMNLAVGMPGPFEFFVILVIVVILFGVGKLPAVLGQMGKGLKAFKDGAKNGDDDDSVDVTPEAPEEEPKALDEAAPTVESPDVEEAQEVVADASDEDKTE